MLVQTDRPSSWSPVSWWPARSSAPWPSSCSLPRGGSPVPQRALVGHGIGEAFQPRQGGTSVAFAALLGGLAAQALRRGARVPAVLRVEAALAVPLAVADTLLRDIHGLPFLAGLLLAMLWLRQDAASHRPVAARPRRPRPARLPSTVDR